MAKMMKIPVLGVVENMSWLKCPDCNKKISLFGGEIAEDSEVEAAFGGVKLLARIPLDPALAALCDRGNIEDMQNDSLAALADTLSKEL